MEIETLLDTVRSYDASSDLEIIRKAYYFAERLHEGQMRQSGEPFVIHPFEVATILATLQMDTTTIAAALLHDTIEDTVASYEQIEKEFGKEIALLVDGVTKLTAISTSKENSQEGAVLKTKAESQAENLRKIFLAMAKDIRVILVKLADRLHNMRTLSAMKPEKQRRIALLHPGYQFMRTVFHLVDRAGDRANLRRMEGLHRIHDDDDRFDGFQDMRHFVQPG